MYANIINMITPELQSEIQQLSMEDKLSLFAQIRDEVAPVSKDAFSELSPEQLTELKRRASKLESQLSQALKSEDIGLSWSSFKAKLSTHIES